MRRSLSAARRGSLVLLGDLTHVASSRDGRVPPGVPAEGRLRQTSLTVAAGQRVFDDGRTTVDVLAGVRAWHLRSQLSVLGGALSRSPGKTFGDPIAALRIHTAFAPRWSALLQADVGGFGVGSDFTAQAVAAVNYSIDQRLTVSGGYRTLSVDYRDGGTRIDATLSGPLLGLTWRF